MGFEGETPKVVREFERGDSEILRQLHPLNDLQSAYDKQAREQAEAQSAAVVPSESDQADHDSEAYRRQGGSSCDLIWAPLKGLLDWGSAGVQSTVSIALEKTSEGAGVVSSLVVPPGAIQVGGCSVQPHMC